MTSVHHLIVTIVGPRPAVFRRLEVPSDFTLAQLHRVVQAAFAWTDTHLHEFEFDDIRYGPLDDEAECEDESAVRLVDLIGEGASLAYLYDFSDDWHHDVTVDEIREAEPGVVYPRCTGGENAGPPEDCGGTDGYEDLRQTLLDDEDPEHDAMLEWVGGAFDPSFFDPEEVDERLRRDQLLKPKPKR